MALNGERLMFRKFIVVAAALLASGAMAADLPSQAPAPAYLYSPRPVVNWSGAYLGDQLGAGFANDSYRGNAAVGGALVFSANTADSGITFGPYLGYNWQVSSNFVLGVEANLDAAWILGKQSTLVAPGGGVLLPAGGRIGEWIQSQGALRARAGVVFDNILLYGAGGFALANVQSKYAALAPGGGVDNLRAWRSGWTIGAGLEYALPGNWSARIEYAYTSFGNWTDRAASIGDIFFTGKNIRHNLTENAVRVGLSYRFSDFLSPVVAKY